MLTKNDVKNIIDGCCKAAALGLENGHKAKLDDLSLDFLEPPTDFMGLKNNPAIFINSDTFHLLGKFHKSWVVNKTIAVTKGLLEETPLQVLGILIHETGHAFNVAAGITNSEGNAYLFEIEVLSKWFWEKNTLLSGFSKKEILDYFSARLANYYQATNNKYLAKLIIEIENGQIPFKKSVKQTFFSPKHVNTPTSNSCLTSQFSFNLFKGTKKLCPTKDELQISENMLASLGENKEYFDDSQCVIL